VSVEIDGVRYSWNAPICWQDWELRHPDRDPVRARYAHAVTCAYCGEQTDSGIFVRADPRSVPFPPLEDDDRG
jgi:hypothetical protein